jgi:hypothetical protein
MASAQAWAQVMAQAMFSALRNKPSRHWPIGSGYGSGLV